MVSGRVRSATVVAHSPLEEDMQEQPVRRKPRYVLGTFWLLLGVAGVVGGIAKGNIGPVLVGFLAVAYSIYLYRGGRFGIIVW
jgi:hypothetical protein